MKTWRGLAEFAPGRRGTAVAIGNFDGLHLGHRRILETLGRAASSRGLRSIVLTFDPHPERAFGRGRTLMIETLDERLARLSEACVDGVLVTGFDRRMASLRPRDFVARILKDRLRAELVVVGRDFRFGRGRSGDVRALERLGRPLGIRTLAVAPVRKNGRVASSSLIRSLLARGLVADAAKLLGRPYSVTGRIVHGRAVGQRLGFPTANLESSNEILPRGVFITVARVGQDLHPAVTNVGVRPTFGPGRVSVETVLLDRGGDLYGRSMEVFFLEKVRPERKFRAPEALARRIELDVRAARAYFRTHPARASSLGLRSRGKR